MHVQVKEQSLVIFSFKALNYIYIYIYIYILALEKGAQTHLITHFQSASLRSDEIDN